MVSIGAPIFAHEQTMDNYRYIPIEHAYFIDETGAYLVELTREEDGRWSATLPGLPEFTIRGKCQSLTEPIRGLRCVD